MPTRSNWPNSLLSAASSRSPFGRRGPLTAVWLSSAVEKIWCAWSGSSWLQIDQFGHDTPNVSMPSDSGVTSSSSNVFTSPCKTPAWIAAPIATTSSGLRPCAARVRRTRAQCRRLSASAVNPADKDHLVDILGGHSGIFERGAARPDGFLDQSPTSASSLARVKVIVRCLGPV